MMLLRQGDRLTVVDAVSASAGPRVHVLYEYGADYRPHASAHLRLLRPLTHPAIADSVAASFGMAYEGQPVDAVIVDRLWRPDITLDRAQRLLEEISRSGARLIYALDDNLLDLPREREDWPTDEHIAVIELLLERADAVMVTSRVLAQRLAGLTRDVHVLPHALDDRLLAGTQPPQRETPFGKRPITIGYMGTSTHADDLAMIVPALRAVCARHGDDVALEIVGVSDEEELGRLLKGLPVRLVSPSPAESEYPLFVTWFTATMQWDIAVSPLRDTPFRSSKSDIKMLDYCAVAAAGVYSRMPAYAGTVRDRETACLAGDDPREWEDVLEWLIDDEEARLAVAHGGARYLHRERRLDRCGASWVDAMIAMTEGARAPKEVCG